MSKISQLFPPSPAFTEASLPDLAGKVFLITGATSGVGLELARILYAANGTVYVGGRDEDKIKDCIRGIISQQTQSSSPPSGSGPGQESNSQCQSNSKTTTAKTGGGGRGGKGRGKLHPFKADLSDLLTIPSAVASFLTKESRLDGLIHNAGVMNPPLERSLSEQGHEVQMATHCLGPFLLTGLLAGLLRRTASSSFSPSLSTSAPAFSFLSPSAPAPAPASGSGSGSEASPSTAGVEKKWDGTAAGEKVGGEGRGGGQGPRVVWVSSMISLGAPKGGIVWDSDSEGINNGPKLAKASMENYMQSKVGSVFLAHEYARRLGRDGVISVVSFSFFLFPFSIFHFFGPFSSPFFLFDFFFFWFLSL